MNIEEAKEAILKEIVGNAEYIHPPEAIKELAKSYAILVSAEIQEMMTKHAISGCEHGGDDSLNDEVIN